MADGTTTNYAFVTPEVGASADSWGTKLNQNWSDLDAYLKAISDAAVTLTGVQTLTNKTLADPSLTGTIRETVYAISGTTPTIDPANGSIQTWTLTANSAPVDGLSSGEAITLMIDDGSAYAITWPTITWKTGGGLAPTLLTAGFTPVVLWKVGSTLYGARVGNA